MEAWTRSCRRAATPRRRPGYGGGNRRQPPRPLGALEQRRAPHGSAQPLLLRIARPTFRRSPSHCLICRTAVYGPVRTVVWEGRSRETPPYPDQRASGIPCALFVGEGVPFEKLGHIVSREGRRLSET